MTPMKQNPACRITRDGLPIIEYFKREREKKYVGQTFGTTKILSFILCTDRSNNKYRVKCLKCSLVRDCWVSIVNRAIKRKGYIQCKCQVPRRCPKEEDDFYRSWVNKKRYRRVKDGSAPVPATMSYKEYRDKYYEDYKQGSRWMHSDGTLREYPADTHRKYRYKIDGMELTRNDICTMLGMTRERVRQLDVKGELRGRVKAYLATGVKKLRHDPLAKKATAK